MRKDSTKALDRIFSATLVSGGAPKACALLLLVALLLFVFPAAGDRVRAQNGKKQGASRSQNKKEKVEAKDEAAAQLARSREEFIRLTKEYKSSLDQLIGLYEKDVQ